MEKHTHHQYYYSHDPPIFLYVHSSLRSHNFQVPLHLWKHLPLLGHVPLLGQFSLQEDLSQPLQGLEPLQEAIPLPGYVSVTPGTISSVGENPISRDFVSTTSGAKTASGGNTTSGVFYKWVPVFDKSN